jgi:hypothetical protein
MATIIDAMIISVTSNAEPIRPPPSRMMSGNGCSDARWMRKANVTNLVAMEMAAKYTMDMARYALLLRRVVMFFGDEKQSKKAAFFDWSSISPKK